MYKALSPGAVGLKAENLQQAINFAKDAGFEGVEINIHEAANLVDQLGAEHVRGMFEEAKLKPAGWGMPIDWRTTEENWKKGLDELPRLALAAQSIGAPRTMTWIMPCSNDRDYKANRAFHIERFKPVSDILHQHGCVFGLEFIGPKTLRDSQKYPFIHTMEEMLEMCAEIGPNMGLLLDCWHWYTSGGTVDDIRDLCTPQNVAYVHVNDAPVGIPIDKQIDNKRALPGATGVIDIRGFLATLQQIGYDGPIVPEPFGNAASWAKQSLDAIWKVAGVKD
jgi:sugar phosphate isomerase/epimerase